ncbi:LPXTG cell wall anchor domain-containing protein [uncultured Vagococcus sp.]|uniref:LPXTG cell wall anchor domain-containing protein n=1 Tax=uncultured Vagococcus sp. TaxID=189676 RepID=UPI0025907842|nr:LPXTG cell wall anchor domain-containing protein [uncultured Vagococcus sp.]
MKKAKLSTALLVILAGSFGAPLISAAEAVSEVGTHESAVVLEEKEEPELPVDEEVVEGEVEGENGDEGTGEETEVETPEEKPEENPGTGNEETPPVTPEEPTGGNEGEEGTEEIDELEFEKNEAISEVDYYFEIGVITSEEHARVIAAINDAQTVEEVWDARASIQFVLEFYKENAKTDVQYMYERGMFNKAEYDRLNAAIDAAKSAEEVFSIMENINFDEKFLEAKKNAYNEIWAAYEKGLLTEDELDSLMSDISNATTIEAVNEIMARFRAHIINPTLILNTANLSNTIAEAKTLVEANYTKDSWAIFAAALANSEELLAATEIRMMTNITQVEVDSSTAALKNAMGQLVAVNGKVVDPTAPVLTSVTKTNTTNAANLPETGEKENRLMALYGLMMSGLAGLFLVKKRKAENESL